MINSYFQEPQCFFLETELILPGMQHITKLFCTMRLLQLCHVVSYSITINNSCHNNSSVCGPQSIKILDCYESVPLKFIRIYLQRLQKTKICFCQLLNIQCIFLVHKNFKHLVPLYMNKCLDQLGQAATANKFIDIATFTNSSLIISHLQVVDHIGG